MSISHVPFWLERTSKSRRAAFPRLRGQAETSVAIVGGGLTGCACALSFAQAGIKVLLLEADAIGQAGAARAPGLVREDFDVSFKETAATHGLATARSTWQAFRRASLEIQAVFRRLNIRCDLGPQDLLKLAQRDAAAAQSLRGEYNARRAAGLHHSWVTPAGVSREAAIESGGAIRTRGAKLDPYRACLGLAAAAAQRGAVIHEHSRVIRVRAGKKQVEVRTDGGVVKAEAVVIATPQPLADLKALRRHLKPAARYAVVTSPLPAAVRRTMGQRAAALEQQGTTPHLLRWVADDRALWTGADGPEVPSRARDKALVQRTGQLMYELSVLYPEISGLAAEWSWDATHYDTVDHLPFAGVHRNFPRHLFAMGGSQHGAGFAWLAARVLLRTFKNELIKGDELFGFARVL
jgi:glycine/D-amino acid oxidase-like deaminating enzyme